MFKNFKKNDKYLTVSIYAFAVIAILVAIILIFINNDKKVITIILNVMVDKYIKNSVNTFLSLWKRKSRCLN